MEDERLSALKLKMEELCSAEKKFYYISTIVERLLQTGEEQVVSEIMADARFDLEATFKESVWLKHELTPSFFISHLKDQKKDSILISCIGWSLPQNGQGFTELTRENFPRMQLLLKDIMSYSFSEENQNALESELLSLLREPLILQAGRSAEIFKIMRSSPLLPVMHEDMLSLSEDWYSIITWIIGSNQERALRILIGGWPRFTEAINFLNVPEGKMSLVRYAAHQNCKTDIFAMLSLNQDIFNSVMTGSDIKRTKFYLNFFPQALTECFNSDNPDDRLYEAYVRRLRNDPTTSASVQTLCYMADPGLVASDQLIRLAAEFRIEPLILALIEKGLFTGDHASIVLKAGFATETLVKAIDNELPKVDFGMRYRDADTIDMKLAELQASRLFWTKQEVAKLDDIAGSVGCMTFLIKLHALVRNDFLLQEFLACVHVPLHYLFTKDPLSLPISSTEHVMTIIRNYHSGVFGEIVDRLLDEVSSDMHRALFRLAFSKGSPELAFMISSIMHKKNESLN